MGLVATAAEVLREEGRQFGPALGSVNASAYTLRHALLTASGCHRRAEPVAYWEWESIYDALGAARSTIAAYAPHTTTPDLERWANQPGRTLTEVLDALDAVPASEDVPAPPSITRRSWCHPDTVATCRLPFVPLGMIVLAWGDPERPWEEVVGQFGLTPEMTSWDLLRRLDPPTRHAPSPPDLRGQVRNLHKRMSAQTTALSPVGWLFASAEGEPGLPLTKLVADPEEEGNPCQETR